MINIVFNTLPPIEAQPTETILEAAKKANLALPYSCQTGRCNTCKCKQLGGKSAALHEESGLSEQEKAEGWILSCVRTPLENLELQIDADLLLKLPTTMTIPCRIQSIEKLATDVLSVTLRLPPNTPFEYYPGQYIDIMGPGGLRRSYSLANADGGNKLLELHIRKVTSGEMSEYWFERAKPNELLRLNGPLGTFFLRDVADQDLVFLATGTGIAPVKGMLEGMSKLAEKDRPRSVSVFWGGRTPEDLYWNPSAINCRYIPVLSRADASWPGKRGHVQDVFLAEQPNLENTAIYACGSDAMIQSARDSLFKAGLLAARFFSDAFVCSAMQKTEREV